jgi:hypothetical protein
MGVKIERVSVRSFDFYITFLPFVPAAAGFFALLDAGAGFSCKKYISPHPGPAPDRKNQIFSEKPARQY